MWWEQQQEQTMKYLIFSSGIDCVVKHKALHYHCSSCLLTQVARAWLWETKRREQFLQCFCTENLSWTHFWAMYLKKYVYWSMKSEKNDGRIRGWENNSHDKQSKELCLLTVQTKQMKIVLGYVKDFTQREVTKGFCLKREILFPGKVTYLNVRWSLSSWSATFSPLAVEQA